MPFTGFNASTTSCDVESRWASPFGNPLLYYLIQLDKIDSNYTIFFTKLFTLMTPYYAHCDPKFRQDFIRKTFSKLSSLIFENIYSEEQSCYYTPVYGLETLGGPAGYTTEQIDRMAASWVDKTPRRWGADHRNFVNQRLHHYISSWVNGRTRSSPLPFSQFCTDPYKWATRGGTYPVVLPDTDDKIRNKWGFGIVNLFNGINPYDAACNHKNADTAVVALKEEAKTRLIISTPMSSYLRQSYLTYVFGPMANLRSTLFDKQIVTQFFNSIQNYVALDASSFDQNIPKWFIVDFFKVLLDEVSNMQGDLMPTAELKSDLMALLNDEISSFDRLVIKYGNNTYKYNNGLLSGWRLTSLMGSLASAIVCDFINDSFGTNSPYIVQGDDIIMAYDQFFGDKQNIMDVVDDFGLTVNMKKSTFGPIGEFLKYRYHPNLIDALPARAVRSIFYMNPWLSTEPSSPVHTCVNSHLNLISRLSLCSRSSSFVKTAVNGMVLDLSGLLGFATSRVRELLGVPLEAGGLGCYEMVDFNKYITPYFKSPNSTKSGDAIYKCKSISVPIIQVKQKSHYNSSPMISFLNKFNLHSGKSNERFSTKNVRINNLNVNMTNLQSAITPQPLMSPNPDSDLMVATEPWELEYYSVNRYATLLAVLVPKTSDRRFRVALDSCSGPIIDLASSFIRLAECSFYAALKFFDKVEDSISPPKSIYFDTRYFPSPQARSLTDLIRKSLRSCLTLPSLVFTNLLSTSLYGNYHSFIHTL
jgi:hypothetical protein